jgi:uncharacterized repeat protein (TIGR01451 family)
VVALVAAGVLPAPSALAPSPVAAPDDQAVVVEVPGTPSATSSPCPVLGREDFTYAFSDAGVPAGTEVVDPWTEPVRLGLGRAPVSVTVTLRAGVDLPSGPLCRYAFTFASFARGSAAEPGGPRPVGGPVTGTVDAGSPSLTLRVPAPPCLGRVDLWAGAETYDDADVPPELSIATWEGDGGCTGGGVVADLVVVGVPACPADPLTWWVVNSDGRPVEVEVTLEGGAAPAVRTLVAEPGVTPVQLAGSDDAAAALTVRWRDDSAATRSVREPAPPRLVPGSPPYDARCSGTASPLTLDKTAVPAEGGPVSPGSVVTWSVTVRNTGATALEDVEIVDVVPAHADVTEAGGGEAAPDSRLLRWRVSVGPGEEATVRWSGTVTAAAPAGIDLVNTALAAVYALQDTTRHPLVPAASPGTTGTTGTSGTPGGGPGAAGPPGPRGPLARTGATLLAVLVAAGTAILVGGLLVQASRRRPGGARVL